MGKDKARSKDKVKQGKKAHKRAPVDEVQRFMDTYGVTERLGRPRERVLTWAARVHDRITGDLSRSATAGDLLGDMIADDDRLVLFYLEGILKLYRKSHEALEDPFRSVKDLEDRLGQLSALRGFAQQARKHGAPEPACGWVDQEAAKSTEVLLEVIEDRWMPRDGKIPALSRLSDALLTCDFGKYKKDRKHLHAEVAEELEELSALELDMDELQGDFGVHELRRQLRWFPIYAVSTDGLFQLSSDRNPIKRYVPLLGSELADSKYSKLPGGDRESKPILLSQSLFIANNDFISRLGKIKDRGEEIEAIEHALVGAGLYPSPVEARPEALEILGKTADDFAQIYRDAHAIHDEIEDVGFLRALEKDLAG